MFSSTTAAYFLLLMIMRSISAFGHPQQSHPLLSTTAPNKTSIVLTAAPTLSCWELGVNNRQGLDTRIYPIRQSPICICNSTVSLPQLTPTQDLMSFTHGVDESFYCAYKPSNYHH